MHGLALRVQRPPMTKNRVVRRAIVHCQPNHQRRIKPAAKLIAAFDVDIRRPAQVLAILQHRDRGRSAVEPNVKDVCLFRELRGAALAAEADAGAPWAWVLEFAVRAMAAEPGAAASGTPEGDCRLTSNALLRRRSGWVASIPQGADPMATSSYWHIQLLGGLRAQRSGEGPAPPLTRFRVQKAGALLAYLAYYIHRPQPREILIELFWPEDDLEVARHKLSVALSFLRQDLEPPGIPDGEAG